MKTATAFVASLLVAAATGQASAVNPRMGGPMKHLGVELHGTILHVHVDTGIATPILQNYDETYNAPADVLNDTWYNAQYGWMIEGFWAPPANTFVWIEQISATPGLMAYSGGTMMNQGTFAPIFGTDGSSTRIRWSGMMLHNWYAATSGSTFSATYRVYIGDADGNASLAYTPDEVTIEWTADIDCPADFNTDGSVDFFDIIAFMDAFSNQQPNADFNNDSTFDFFDIVAYLGAFSAGCPA